MMADGIKIEEFEGISCDVGRVGYLITLKGQKKKEAKFSFSVLFRDFLECTYDISVMALIPFAIYPFVFSSCHGAG